MKYTTDNITLDGKTYYATEVDYDGYSTEDGSAIVYGKTFYAHKRYGTEATPGQYSLWFINQLESIFLELVSSTEATISNEKLILPTDGSSISGSKLKIL